MFFVLIETVMSCIVFLVNFERFHFCIDDFIFIIKVNVIIVFASVPINEGAACIYHHYVRAVISYGEVIDRNGAHIIGSRLHCEC